MMKANIPERYKDKAKRPAQTSMNAPDEIGGNIYPCYNLSNAHKYQIDANGKPVKHETKDKEGNVTRIDILKYIPPMVILDVVRTDEIFPKSNVKKCYIRADIGVDEENIVIYSFGENATVDNLLKTKNSTEENVGLPIYVGFKQITTKNQRVAWIIHSFTEEELKQMAENESKYVPEKDASSESVISEVATDEVE